MSAQICYNLQVNGLDTVGTTVAIVTVQADSFPSMCELSYDVIAAMFV